MKFFILVLLALSAVEAEAGAVRGSKAETLAPTERIDFAIEERGDNVTFSRALGVPIHPFTQLRKPAAFPPTEAQIAGSCAPVFLADTMYLTPSGASSTSGEWGEWRKEQDPESVAPSKWHMDFLSWHWENIYVSNEIDGTQAVVAKPQTEEQLKKYYNWSASDQYNTDHRWDFLTEWFAPNVAFYFDQQPYRFEIANDTYPTTITAGPTAKASALLYPTWTHWALVDCKDNLAAVLRVEDTTDSTKAGKILVFNSAGELAAVALPDPILARYQFIDVNGRLLATAEAPTLGANVTYLELPRREELGYTLPYSMHWELGGYNMSSDLLQEESRWILGLSVQVRSLQDAHQNFTPPLVKDRFLLFAVAMAVILCGGMLVFLAVVGVTPEIYSIFFPGRVKAMPG
eukprot:CAMPEP_0197657830 /NCGR_PEP_ID=MMETSP1338-20131121/44869_1 /TAXON_ID=43686 ORGANISM="Pelagodinium beii, Strain RCC1491" /NCGR_SAMPLE_ID=MMETSP1338 /ASSEMBLY_ACC=CAM_ASM_000754 /LENGTH=402 /DNA_ID=CAMNT_0043234291 /DNA_START=94 /DNA_END=1299 /DNA_ORIENTATION=-